MKSFYLSLLFALSLVTGAFAQQPEPPVAPEPQEQAASSDSTNNAEDSSHNEESQPDTRTHHEVVLIGQSFKLPANESARDVVLIGGDAVIDGDIDNSLVVIGGSATIRGEVREVVVVGGRVTLSGTVRDLTVVAGGVEFKEGAQVRREAVVVGGKATGADLAKIGNKLHNVPFMFGFGLAGEFFEQYFRGAVLKLRPLAGGPAVLMVFGLVTVFYLLLALILGSAVRQCVKVMYERPAMSFVVGLLTLVGIAPLIFVLLMSVIGIVLIPFLLAAFVAAGIFGKIVVAAAIGGRILRRREDGLIGNVILAFLLGTLILAIIYFIPIIGLMVWALVGVMGLGNVVLTISSRLVKERPPRPTRPAPTTAPSTGSFGGGTMAGTTAAPMNATTASAAAAPSPTPDIPFSAAGGGAAVLGAPPFIPGFGAAEPSASAAGLAQPEADLYPRAGFWRRFVAGIIDLVLCAIAVGILPFTAPILPLFIVAYQIILWGWRGTTVGGVLLNLKVVRMDGEPMNFPTAVVRGLASLFSELIFFLGYIWVAWDSEKQGWHDKIAGTTVVIMPKGISLI